MTRDPRPVSPEPEPEQQQGREAVPPLLADLIPTIGSEWEWEPLKTHARERVRVTDVRWNGEEVWIESVGMSGRPYCNEFGRWIEATVLVDAHES